MPGERVSNRELLSEYRSGDESALSALVENNLALVRSVAARFFCRDDADDLMQVGSIGLVKAIRNFDPAFGTELSTYAVPMIAGEIRRYLRDTQSVKAGRKLGELSRRIAAILNEAEKRGLEPKLSEIADELGVSPEEAAEAAALNSFNVYLDEKPEDGESRELSELVPDTARTEDEAVGRVFSEQLLSLLDKNERELIEMRYRLDLTQKEAAARLGITQPKASRMEARALLLLRRHIINE
ncbi:MAG: sigma-70 family RNA polymerase sigma factor [Clostridia bacterium]|nr:sigma-70 family RNA polymerase sigma factor [Clostridia bacterium]